MTDSAGGVPLPSSTVQAARREVRCAVATMISESGGRTIARLWSTQQDWPGTNGITPEPVAGLEPAHAIEQAAHALIKDLIRQAREAGRSWHEIGEGLDLHWHPVLAKKSIADVAYDYALSYQAETGMRTFASQPGT